jgi:xanthine dehydrogenase large subunit
VKLSFESLPVHTTLEHCTEDAKFSVYPCKMSIPMTGDAKPLITDNIKVAKGTVKMGTQKHFYMETQTVYVIPDDDDRFVIHCSVQCPGPAQMTVSRALGIPLNKINMTHRRSGGAFGGKAFHPVPLLISVTRAAQQLKRPVRMTLTREEDMWVCGGREEVLSHYQISFDDNGKIQGLRHDGHLSGGASLGISGFVPLLHNRSLHEVYYIPDFASTTETLRSNLCPRTACRGPGEMTASVCMETMIEHVAHETKLSPETVRERNFYPDDMAEKKSPMGEELLNYTINTMWTSLKQKVDYDRRKAEVEAFNQAHRWRKRGLSITPVGYAVSQGAKSASVSIYADGTVLITHTGTEMVEREGEHQRAANFLWGKA